MSDGLDLHHLERRLAAQLDFDESKQRVLENLLAEHLVERRIGRRVGHARRVGRDH